MDRAPESPRNIIAELPRAKSIATRLVAASFALGSFLKIELHTNVPASPIRSELFSTERLEQHAKSLAEAQRVGPAPLRIVSLPRKLKRNARQLVADYRALAKTANAAKPITSAGEWFLDNFYIVEEQAREVVKECVKEA